MRHDSRGNVLDVGRKTRRISTPLRRALSERDGGCRFPGCPNHQVDAHHVKAWADGGETKLANLLTLCRFHHAQVHEGGYRIAVSKDGEAVFIDPEGKHVASAGRLAPVTAVPNVEATPSRGASWWSSRCDLGLAVSGLLPSIRRD